MYHLVCVVLCHIFDRFGAVRVFAEFALSKYV